MHRERCIWVRLYCLSSSSIAQLWVHPCQHVPPWILTMWKERGSRRYEVKFWANSDWQAPHTPWDRVKSPIKSKHCITAPRSYWRSLGGIDSRVAVRTTQRQSTTPKRYTNSTWSTGRQKAVSIIILLADQPQSLSSFYASNQRFGALRNYAPNEEWLIVTDKCLFYLVVQQLYVYHQVSISLFKKGKCFFGFCKTEGELSVHLGGCALLLEFLTNLF